MRPNTIINSVICGVFRIKYRTTSMEATKPTALNVKLDFFIFVIETYFMPYGMDNEHYTILGKIKKFEQITNEFSDEMVYNLTVVCNGIDFLKHPYHLILLLQSVYVFLYY